MTSFLSPLHSLPLTNLFELSNNGPQFRANIASGQEWLEVFTAKSKEMQQFLDQVYSHMATLVSGSTLIANVKQERAESAVPVPEIEPVEDEQLKPDSSDTDSEYDSHMEDEDMKQPALARVPQQPRQVRDRNITAKLDRVSLIQYAQQELRDGKGGFVLDFKEHAALRKVQDDVTQGGSVMVAVEFNRYSTHEAACEAAYIMLCDALGEEPTRTSYPYARWDKYTSDITTVGAKLFNAEDGISLQAVLYRSTKRLSSHRKRSFAWWCYNSDDGSLTAETVAHVEKVAEQSGGFSGRRLLLMLERGWVKY